LFVVLLTNIELTLKGLPGSNTLTYFAFLALTNKKGFTASASRQSAQPGANIIRLFSFCHLQKKEK